MYSEIKCQIDKFKETSFSTERKEVMQSLVDFIQSKKDKNEAINLNFVCTHNSRRSHLSQIWAQVMAYYFKIDNVYCYSGGTEVTALFPKVAETLGYAGFTISKLSEENNPVFAIKYGADVLPVIGFSKKYDDAFNPRINFAAIMTCGHADENCPFIPGAERRIPLTFEDPKAFDGTPLQDVKYRERSVEIASQLYYVFSKIR